MTRPNPSALPALVPLLVVSVIVVLVTFGFAKGFWVSNAHNGLLALSFAGVGAYVLLQRPGHLTGVLFLATGAVEAVMFFGRQAGHYDSGEASIWLAWLGVWPIALALGLTTLCVAYFPDGRLPSPRWKPVVVAVCIVAGLCSAVSAIWPVEYVSAEVTAPHPLNTTTPPAVETAWTLLAHPAYVAFQVLWVVIVVVRWRTANGHVRSQLAWLAGAAAVSVIALAVGLIGWGTATPGIFAATLIPVAAGWAILHGQHLAEYSALTWLSRSGPRTQDLPNDLARAAAQALSAPRATLWMGTESELLAVGVWPDAVETLEPTNLDSLRDASGLHTRAVRGSGVVIGALSIERPANDHSSQADSRLLDHLAAQASLVLEHQNLADVIASERNAGHLDGLSPREQQVLDLMARGLSNAAICEELHLSIKTVEPIVGTIFTKLNLHPDAGSNRRVLAVLAYLRT